MIEVNGYITNPTGEDIIIFILTPLNSIVTIDQLTVADDGSFETTLNTAGNMWKYDGTYTIEVSYGDYDRTPMTTFDIGISSSSIYSHSPDLDVIISYSEVNGVTQINLIFSEINVHYEITVLQNGEIILQETAYSMKLTTSYTVNAIASHKHPIDINIIPLGTIPSNSDNTSLTITTDNSTYHEGTPISISGNFNNYHNGTSLHISLQSPNGHLSPIHNIITTNNSYTITIPTGNNTTITTPGLYTLTAHYGNNTASATFDYYVDSDDSQEAYFIPDEQYLTLSDRDINKWSGELTKWQNAQDRTNNNTEFYYEKLDEAISNNQTNRINLFTEKIGHSLALSSLYDGIIECLEEELESLS